MRAAVERTLEVPLTEGADYEQADGKTGVTGTQHDVGPWSYVGRSGAKRPTPSEPAVAASAVRHQASHVRSAAIEVRCTTSAAGDCGAAGRSGFVMR